MKRLCPAATIFIFNLLAAFGDQAPQLGQLAVGPNADGQLQIFKVDKNGALRRRVQKETDGDWTSWSSLGGTIYPGIAVTSNDHGTLGVFAVDKATQRLEWIHQKTVNGSWSGWIDLGGTIQAPVAVGQNADGRIEVFAVNAADATAM